MHQDISRARRTRSAIGADHAVGRKRNLDLRRFEPLVEQIGRTGGEDLNQIGDIARSELTEASQQLQVLDQVATAASEGVPEA